MSPSLELAAHQHHHRPAHTDRPLDLLNRITNHTNNMHGSHSRLRHGETGGIGSSWPPW